MGQTTMGILWGVCVPTGVVLRDDENDNGTLDHWERACADLIEAHDDGEDAWLAAKPGRRPRQRIDGVDRYVPDWPPDVHMAGFWVAVGASGMGGVPNLMRWHNPGHRPVALSLGGVREAYPRGFRNARARWRRFREWASAHREIAGCDHFATTLPSLWLVPTEVA